MTVRLTCVGCGGEFFTKPYRAEAQKYCNKDCRKEHLDRMVTLACECCGKEFQSYLSQLALNPRRTCSVECRRKLNPPAPKPEKKVREPVFKVCKTCGATFRIPPARKDTALYCSTKCKGEDPDYRRLSSVQQRAEKSWRYSGGVSAGQDGYMKQRVWGDDVVWDTKQHRVILTAALVESEPSHPFLVEVDGILRLRPEIHVHHIDRDRKNNDLSNLLAVTASAHANIHKNGRKPNPWECWPANPAKW